MDSKLARVETEDGEDFVYMTSAPNGDGPRDSVRLEGRRRFERGLFLRDVRHMPDGCGVWPAFWLTDEDIWPANGEVDILEGARIRNVRIIVHRIDSSPHFRKGVNGKTTAKTALHTSNECDMYAHVSPWNMTGNWEWISK